MNGLVLTMLISIFHCSCIDSNITFKLCDEIISMGKYLPLMYSELPVFQGDKFVEDIKLYNAKMKEFANLLRSDKQNLQDALAYLLNDGCPKYLTLNVPDDKVKQRFNWTDKDIGKLEALMIATYNAYAELVFLHDTPSKFI